MHTYLYFFKIARDANLAIDEDGEPIEAVIQFSLTLRGEDDRDLDSREANARKVLGRYLRIDPDLLTIIDSEEFARSAAE